MRFKMEVDDIISYHDVVTTKSRGTHASRVLVSAPRRNELCWLSMLALCSFNGARWRSRNNRGNGFRLVSVSQPAPVVGRGKLLEANRHFTISCSRVFSISVQTEGADIAIGGFGYFARYSPLSEWLAWDCFRQANGCGSFEEMHARLERIRRGSDKSDAKGILQIGCIIVVNATFFASPNGFHNRATGQSRNLRHAVYDLDVGEGIRVWAECLTRVQPDRELRVAEPEAPIEMPRYGSPILIQPRLGQGAFRVSVTEAYNRACAVTQEHSLPALEAAHIRPFANEGPHEVQTECFYEQIFIACSNKATSPSDRITRWKSAIGCEMTIRMAEVITRFAALGFLCRLSDRERPTPDLLAWHNQNVFLQ